MANKKFSDLTAATTVAGGDIIAIETVAGNSRKVAASVVGVACGTAFPVAPSSGDRFYRTDRVIEYFYDGTQWLSTQIFSLNIDQTTQGITGNTNFILNVPYLPTYNCYLIAWDTTVYRSAAGEWDMVLSSLDSAGAATTIDTQDGSADATTTYVNRSRGLTTLLTSSVKALRIAATEISGTAGLIFGASVQYRLVG